MPATRLWRPGMAGVLVALAIVAALVLVLSGGGRSFSTAPAEPAAEYESNGANVVVVMTDDQALDTMRAMPRTRRLLGDAGVTFENVVATFPLCCPSRATFQTGQYAHNNGVLNNSGPRGGYQALDAENTLPVWLARAGYRTGFVGKYLNGYGKGDEAREVPPGWTDWYGLPANAKQRPFEFDLNENGELVPYTADDYKTDVLAERSTSFVREWSQDERPFFLWVATDAPHKDAGVDEEAERNPEPAPRDLGRFEDESAPRPPSFNERDVADKPGFVKGRRELNRAEIAEIDKIYRSQLESLIGVDRLVRDIVRELRRHDQLDNTVIMFTSDHGFLRGHHRLDSGKSSVYEEAIRIPLLVRGPGFPEGLSDERVVGNIDLAPTIMELTGADAGLEMDGRSLLPYDGDRDRDRSVLLEVYERKTGNFLGVRTPRYVYAEYESDKHELYDLHDDPHQLDNLADRPDHADLQAELAERVADLRGCAGQSCR